MKLFFFALLAQHAFLTSATLDNVSSRLQVEIPVNLFRDEGYDHREALFGKPLYGGAIAEKVIYADSDLCDSNVDTHKGYPCTSYDSDGKCTPWSGRFILMVDRGACHFVTKALNAQNAGAAGVLIADNQCQCSSVGAGLCTNDPGIDCESFLPIMADDGNGGVVTIPSFLMLKQDADIIKNTLKSNQNVQVKMSWNMPAPDDRVEWDLWSTPSETVSQHFQASFLDKVIALGAHAFFTPHYYVYDGISNGCHGDGSPCGNLCINKGRYCSTDPDNDMEKGISGADVVKESLRELCVWKHYGGDGIGKSWWMYKKCFIEQCSSSPATFSSPVCIDTCFTEAGILTSTIESCINDSGGFDADVSNTLLDAEISAKTSLGVLVIPSAFVNEVTIRGALNEATVFSSICVGFKDGTQPDICKQCNGCPDLDTCIAQGVCGGGSSSESSGGIGVATLVAALCFTVGIMGTAAYIHHKRSQREMRDQVRGILAEYMPLDDGAMQLSVKSGGSTANL